MVVGSGRASCKIGSSGVELSRTSLGRVLRKVTFLGSVDSLGSLPLFGTISGASKLRTLSHLGRIRPRASDQKR